MNNAPLPPQVSVIIPTYNRAGVLARTLAALLQGQRAAPPALELPSFEVIVVDDGSRDRTPTLLTSLARDYPQLLVLRQANARQGAARNSGMRQARGELFILLGDDTLPAPDLLARHWRAYLQAGRPTHYSAIGHIDWHPRLQITPFRRWINDDGVQFGFARIKDPTRVPFNFFYASNLALSRPLYRDFGGFDEQFDSYGWEDIELGYRYQRRGDVWLRYVADAVAYHDHELSLPLVCQRRQQVGFAAARFAARHPELGPWLKLDLYRRYRHLAPLLTAAAPLLRPIAALLHQIDHRRINVNHLCRRLLWLHYFLGLRQAHRRPTARLSLWR